MSALSSGPVLHPTHPALRVVGRAAAVVGGGFLLLNLAFSVYAMLFQLVRRVGMLVVGGGTPSEGVLLTTNLLVVVVWLAAVAGGTVWALRRWPRGVASAAWLAVPTASVLLPIGIALVDLPVAVTLGFCGVLVLGVLAVMARTHQPWEQLLSVAWVAVALAAMVLLGVDI